MMRARHVTTTKAVAVMTAASSLLWLAACGSSEPDNTTTSTAEVDFDTAALGQTVATTLGEAVGDDEPLTTDGEETTCIGSSLATSLGNGAEALGETGSGVGDWTEEQTGAVTEAIDHCVSGDSVAPALTASLYAGMGLGAPGKEVVECVADGVGDEVGTVVFESIDAAESSATPTETVAVLDRFMPQADLEALFTSAVVASGATPVVAACIGGRVSGELTLADLLEISSDDGQIPVDLQATLDDARMACGG